MICRMYAFGLPEDETDIFKTDDDAKELVDAYKARKALEGGAQSINDNDSRVGGLISNTEVTFKTLRNGLGALINTSKASSSSGMLSGLGGGSVVTPVQPVKILRRSDRFIPWDDYVETLMRYPWDDWPDMFIHTRIFRMTNQPVKVLRRRSGNGGVISWGDYLKAFNADSLFFAEICAWHKIAEMLARGQTSLANTEILRLERQSTDLLRSYQTATLPAQKLKPISDGLQECIDERDLIPRGVEMWRRYDDCRAARGGHKAQPFLPGAMSHISEMICRMYAHGLIGAVDDDFLFQPDDALEHLVEEYKARKAHEGAGGERGAQSNNLSQQLGAWKSNARAKIKNAENNLGATINQIKSSAAGMPQGLGGIGAKPPVFAGPSL
ncbi:MAG: hypothetical protein M1816_004770 [Peltula sp. TS41687]|nr:MAG: hypothetical protein M1816_004770 [Peltula sp. TS41687]